MGMALAGVGGAVAGPTVLLFDGFPDANGTNLLSDASGIWIFVIGTFYTQNDAAQPNSDTDSDTIVANATQSDFTLTCGVTPVYSDTSDTEHPCVLFRYSDSGDFIYVQVTADKGTVDLLDCQSGAFTVRGSSTQTIASGSTHTVQVVVSGPSIAVYWDGSNVITYSSTFNETATRVGLRLGKAGTPPGKCSWDNFKVTQ